MGGLVVLLAAALAAQEPEPTQRLRVRLLTPTGEPLDEALRAAGLPGIETIGVVAQRGPLPARLPSLEGRDHAANGLAHWRDRAGMIAARRPLPKVFAGELEVRAAPPFDVAALLGPVVLATARVDGASAVAAGPEGDAAGTSLGQLTLRVPVEAVRGALGRLRLRVLAAEGGAPIAGAVVEVRTSPRTVLARSSAVDGSVTFPYVPAGIHELLVRGPSSSAPPAGSPSASVSPAPPGATRPSTAVRPSPPLPTFAAVRRHVRLAPGADGDVGDVALDTARVLQGIVVDAAGKPCRAVIHRWRLDGVAFPQELQGSVSSETDERGAFAAIVGRGRILVRAVAADGRRAATIVDAAPPGELPPLRLTVRSGPIVRLVWRGEGTALLATIRDAQGVPWHTERATAGGHAALPLPRGAFVLEVHRDDELVRRVEFTVAAEPVLLTIEP